MKTSCLLRSSWWLGWVSALATVAACGAETTTAGPGAAEGDEAAAGDGGVTAEDENLDDGQGEGAEGTGGGEGAEGVPTTGEGTEGSEGTEGAPPTEGAEGSTSGEGSEGFEGIEGGAEGLEGTAGGEGAEGGAEGPEGSGEGTEGTAEGTEGAVEGIEGSGEGVEGAAEGTEGAIEGFEGGGEGTEGSGEGAEGATEGTEGGAFVPPVPDECITDVSPGERELPCEGYDYDIMIPEACVKRSCGMVFDVHGLGMSGEIMEMNTKFREFGKKHEYIVVQPNANPGPPTGGYYPSDYPPIWAFAERVAKVFHVDPKRWHFHGFSQGGRLTWNMLCEHSDKLASVAPAAYGLDLTDPCSKSQGGVPAVEIPVLYMHGTKDTVRFFKEAETQRDNIIDDWKMSVDTVVSQDAMHVWTRYKNANGNIFEFFQHDYKADSSLYNGHCIPGGPQKGGILGFGCEETGTPNWPEKVWEFFIAHPKP